MSSHDTSSTRGSEALRSGSSIAGFELVRPLAKGSFGSVFEAVQISLGRTVALRLLNADVFADATAQERFVQQQTRLAAIHHPSIVPTYEIGEWQGGRFVATRFVGEESLEQALARGSLEPERARELLGPVAEALDAAHAQDVVHGRIAAHNILIDSAGQLLLADLGLERGGDEAADRAALEELAEAIACARPVRRRHRLYWVAAGSVLAAAAVTVALLAGGGEDEPQATARLAPAVTAETMPLGSSLAPGPYESLGCAPELTPNTPACTLLQTELDRHTLVVRRRGIIRGWAVRGASGELTLTVIRQFDDKPFFRGFSTTEQVSGEEPQLFASSILVRPGDRVGLLLGPGSAVGLRPAGASLLRWGGALPSRPRIPRTPTLLDGELLLRVDVDAGARPPPAQLLRGDEAAAASTGERFAAVTIDLSATRSAEVAVVFSEAAIFIDVFDRGERQARIAVADADPAGELVELEPSCGPYRGFCLQWQNEDDTAIGHEYKLNRDGTGIRLIG